MRGNNSFIAFAGVRLQLLAIEDKDRSPLVSNGPTTLEPCGHTRNRSAPSPQSARQRVMRHWNGTVWRFVMSGQEPSAKSLFHGVKFVANSSLRNLNKQCIRVLKKYTVHNIT